VRLTFDFRHVSLTKAEACDCSLNAQEKMLMTGNLAQNDRAGAHAALLEAVVEGSTGLGCDLIWGVTGIGREIGRNQRQTFHLLENGRIPAKKVGGRWCASRAGLRRYFASILAGEVT
jgi:hypothetical protein